MAKHNKKRNIGIVYELLLRHISHSLIENNISEVKVATKIIEKHFNKNTELFKEFRLVNALINSDVKNTEVAAAIMTEAKEAARRTDKTIIEKEKSSLIRDINYKIKDKNFYYRNVPNYVDYANVQNLVNEWRKKDRSDLKKLVELESKAINILLRERSEIQKDAFSEKKSLDAKQSDKLIIKLMTEKINAKYTNMSSDQKEIIKNYALYNNTENTNKLVTFLKEQKQRCLDKIINFEKTNDNQFIQRKISAVKEKIVQLNEHDVTDKSIVKFMTLSDLVLELEGE